MYYFPSDIEFEGILLEGEVHIHKAIYILIRLGFEQMMVSREKNASNITSCFVSIGFAWNLQLNL